MSAYWVAYALLMAIQAAASFALVRFFGWRAWALGAALALSASLVDGIKP